VEAWVNESDSSDLEIKMLRKMQTICGCYGCVAKDFTLEISLSVFVKNPELKPALCSFSKLYNLAE
jgi:hypothetical protein